MAFAWRGTPFNAGLICYIMAKGSLFCFHGAQFLYERAQIFHILSWIGQFADQWQPHRMKYIFYLFSRRAQASSTV